MVKLTVSGCDRSPVRVNVIDPSVPGSAPLVTDTLTVGPSVSTPVKVIDWAPPVNVKVPLPAVPPGVNVFTVPRTVSRSPGAVVVEAPPPTDSAAPA